MAAIVLLIKYMVCLQVISLHNVTQKLVSLIPFITSKDIEIIEVDWKIETIDVPVASKRRILIGKKCSYFSAGFFLLYECIGSMAYAFIFFDCSTSS